MALDNLISLSFTEEELTQLQSAIDSINQVLQGKVVNLTPDERSQYGSIADRNKILVDKCKDYMDQDPDTIPRTLDKTEFDADYIARKQVEMPLRDLTRVTEKLMDTKILLDHDNYQAAIAYYRYIKYLASESEPGSTSIYQDLKKHFKSVGSSTAEEETNTDETIMED